MKKQGVPPLIVITLVFLAFTLGLFVANNRQSEIQVTVAQAMQTVPPLAAVPTESTVNINTATKEELMTLPGIGEELAQRILDYRKAVVLFSAPEELLNVEGLGTKRLEEMLHLITIGG